jgi:hypothetical protein
MTHLYFHCAGPAEILIDHRGTDILDLTEARDHALAMARFIVECAYGERDFSEWLVLVSDEDDDEMLLVPFTAALPTMH